MCTCWIVLVYVCYGVYVHVFGKNTHTPEHARLCTERDAVRAGILFVCEVCGAVVSNKKTHPNHLTTPSSLSLPPTKGRTEKPTQILPTPFVPQRNFTINEELKHIMRHKQVSRNGGSTAVGLFPSAFLFLATRRSVSCVFWFF